jgi:MFS family permease
VKAHQPQSISRAGLNAANFFQAEMAGVVVPVLGAYLQSEHWKYGAIGIATAAAGLGTLLMQTPAGVITDRFPSRRLLFAITCIVTGVSLGALPFVKQTSLWVDGLMFLSGVTASFFAPVLGALALGLVGHAALNRVIGANQGWNHAGNIAAALIGMFVVSRYGMASVFVAVAVTSLFAALSVLLIRPGDVDETLATGRTDEDSGKSKIGWLQLLRDHRILFLFLAIALFHFANAPILPQVAMYVKSLGGSNKLMTATVLTAQLVMVPVALWSGRLCDTLGRKPIMGFAFLVLPLRIFSYTLVHSPQALVVLQSLDGIGAGIYGVAVVAFAADLTRGKGGFNTLNGLLATAVSVGGVVGPIVAGELTQRLGFRPMFAVFAAIAAVAFFILFSGVPETKPQAQASRELAPAA